MPGQESYLPDEIEVGFVFDGALRKTLPFARKAFQLLDSSTNWVQGMNINNIFNQHRLFAVSKFS